MSGSSRGSGGRGDGDSGAFNGETADEVVVIRVLVRDNLNGVVGLGGQVGGHVPGVATRVLNAGGNGSARGGSGHGTPLEAQSDSAAGGGLPGEGGGLAHLEGVAISGDVERVGLAVGSSDSSQSGDSERSEETHGE